MSLLARSTIGRSVHLSVEPRPQSLSDSRHIVRMLERFGEVEMFRHLKYDPDSPAPHKFLAIFRDETSAHQAKAGGSIDFHYPERARKSLRDLERFKIEGVEADTTSESAARPGLITVKSSQMDHQKYIARQAYYGPYGRSNGAISDDLHNRLPRGLSGMAALSYGKSEVPLRIRQKREQKETPEGRSLMRLWEQYQAGLKTEDQAGVGAGSQS